MLCYINLSLLHVWFKSCVGVLVKFWYDFKKPLLWVWDRLCVSVCGNHKTATNRFYCTKQIFHMNWFVQLEVETESNRLSVLFNKTRLRCVEIEPNGMLNHMNIIVLFFPCLGSFNFCNFLLFFLFFNTRLTCIQKHVSYT